MNHVEKGIFGYQVMSVVFSNCAECKHLIVEENFKYKCKAFPEGIPREFMFRKDQDVNEECNKGVKFAKED